MPCARRNLLLATGAACGLGGVGAALPLLGSMAPGALARLQGGARRVELGQLAPGEHLVLRWRGMPVWVLRRTPAMLDALARGEQHLADPMSLRGTTPSWARNRWRSLRPEFLVFSNVCTHLGCVPELRLNGGGDLPQHWPGGFACPCHGSLYDLAARVWRDMPAPDNMPVPDYEFIADTTIVLGVHRD